MSAAARSTARCRFAEKIERLGADLAAAIAAEIFSTVARSCLHTGRRGMRPPAAKRNAERRPRERTSALILP